jgi:tRNA(Ile)-lysidine synthetase-like protein
VRILELARGASSGHWVPLGTLFRGELAFGRLGIHRIRPAAGAPDVLDLGARGGEAAWGDWSLRWTIDAAPARHERIGMSAWFAADALRVRLAERGERISPIGGSGARALARCFQEARIPRRRRGGWPVLEWAGHAVWVPGVCRADALVPEPGAEALRVDVTDR